MVGDVITTNKELQNEKYNIYILRCQNNFIYLHSENECIMELFKGQSLLEFTERFKKDLDSEEYLASLKWEDGYCCRKVMKLVVRLHIILCKKSVKL